MKYYPGVFGGNIAFDYLKIKAPITLAIIAINLTIFIASFILGIERQIIMLGGMAPITYVIASGEYWRILTSIFIHSGVMHVLFNMVILLHAGGYLEPSLGSKKFGLFYLGSGLLVSLASGIFTQSISVGASGAIFALLGFLLYFDLLARKNGMRSNSMIVPLVLFNMLITVLIPQISFVGHFSGLVIGYLFAAYKFQMTLKKKQASER